MDDTSTRKPLSRIQSVSRRFSYAFIGAVTLLLFGFAVVAGFVSSARINAELERRADHASQLAAISLPIALWKGDILVLDDIAKTIMLDEAIVYVTILDQQIVVFRDARKQYEDKDYSYFINSPNFIVKEQQLYYSDIDYQNQSVGAIKLVVSREGVKYEVISNILGIVALTISIIVAISLTSIFITRRYISRPLSKLQKSAALIAAGDLQAPIDKTSSDEIGNLAQDLDAMRGSIREARENLEQKVETRTRDLTEALEQQTATGEVLGVISSSPTDAQPVFDMIAESAVRLCNGEFGGVFQFDGELIHLVGHHGLTTEGIEVYNQAFPRPVARDSAIGRAISSCAVAHIQDVQVDPDYGLTALAQVGTIRCIIGVPMLREAKPIGGIVVWRSVPELFSDKQIELLKTFAEQAVIAIENVRLFQALEARNREVTESLEQQTATGEVLGVISSSPTDAQPVFDMIARSAKQLCHGEFCAVFRFDGELIHLVGHHGLTHDAVEAYQRAYPMAASRGHAIGRAILTRAIAHIPDVEADSEYTGSTIVHAMSARSVIAVPMLREGSPIGGIVVLRSLAELFSDKQIELLKTFAEQAVIAIENVRLFQALEARTQELMRSVGELKALGEIGQAISSTLDLETVLATIVARAVALSRTDAGTIYEFDETEQVFDPRANYGMSEALVEALRGSRIGIGDGTVGQAAAQRAAVQIPDIENEPTHLLHDLHKRAGFRALLAVPLLRKERIIGGLVVRRKTAGEFPQDILDLLQTFATQSALAIQNARLFHEIEDKGQQLEAASQHKSQFLANMSHELRTPLNSVIGFSEVLLEKMFGELNDKQEEYLNDIFTSGKHLLNLINDILDLSKIEAGKMELELGTVNLRQLLEGSLVVVKERALAHGIRLSFDISEDVGTCVADERKVKQIVFNLLSNAVKFTPDSGQVGIKAHRTDGLVEVAVWDTGVGIAPEDQKRIFEEFQQAGHELTGKPEGTGLGLTLSRKLVELHGGKIWVQSTSGQGSTFTFTLPASDETRRAKLTVDEKALGERMASTAAVGPLTLVIEDDPKAVELLRIYLGEAGYRVETAKDGEEGLEKTRRLAPAAIILDVLLPTVDGWDFLAKIKADAATRDIPVIIASILDQKGKGFALGAADYLVKPIKKKALLKILDTFGLREKRRTGLTKVLAIDDDPNAIQLVAAALEPEGFQVLKSRSGEEGIKIAAAEQPDIIVLDLLMPGMNGFEVLDRLKASPATSKLPVVLFTVKHLSTDEKKRLKGRIAKLAQKEEYTPQRLASMVREVLHAT